MKWHRIFSSVMMALIFCALILPRASAQTPERFASLKISIWPEYDQPSVLVMFDGVLADASNLPRAVSILIPADAQLFVTTWQNPDGSLAPEQPAQQTRQDDGYTRVTFTIAQPKFRVEYYHAALRGAPDKTFDFAYKSIGAVDAVRLEIQQPLKASNFAVTPATSTTRTDADGFHYALQTYSNIAAGQIITSQVKYTKTDPHPSIIQPQAAPAPRVTDEGSNWFLLIALVTLGTVGVLGGFWWWQRRAEMPTALSASSARRRRGGKRRAVKTVSAFCTQCGRALGDDDNFCPACGTKRRGVT